MKQRTTPRTTKNLLSLAGAALLAGCIAGSARAADDQIARGQYLTTMGDCIGCHQGEGYAPYSGGRYMDMPFGKIYVPNITPDKRTGIGSWTDAQFIRLMRHGIAADGTYIYPAMPYPWYNTMTTEDLLAIKAYLFSLKPVNSPSKPEEIWFPFTIRPAIALWDAFFVPDKVFKPIASQSALVNRGDYIVNGPEHCGACHNNRNFLGNIPAALSVEGAPITMWYAPNLRPDNLTGIGRYSIDDLVKFFKYGHSEAMGPVAGPMGEVVDYSTSQLNDFDLHAISAYLKSLKPVASYQARTAAYRPDRYAAGQAVYLEHCASCHQLSGDGIKDKIPALDGNGMVRALGPQSVIRVVIGGHPARGPYALMPGVGAAMSDREVVDVTNFIRQSWSNHAPANASLVLTSLIRKDTSTLQKRSTAEWLPGAGAAGAQADHRRPVQRRRRPVEQHGCGQHAPERQCHHRESEGGRPDTRQRHHRQRVGRRLLPDRRERYQSPGRPEELAAHPFRRPRLCATDHRRQRLIVRERRVSCISGCSW